MKTLTKTLVTLGLAAAGCKAPQSGNSASAVKEADVVNADPQAPAQQANVDLTGDHLGYMNYSGEEGKRRAVRVYFHAVKSQPDTYNVTVVEYPQLLTIAPQFVATPQPQDGNLAAKIKGPLHKFLGDLKKISERIVVYRATKRAGVEGQFVLKRLLVGPDSRSLIVEEGETPSVLMLDKFMMRTESPFRGARISRSSVGEPAEIVFPRSALEKTGIEYRLAQATYRVADLKSTWRDQWLTGRYLARYGAENDVVMQLNDDGGQLSADFLDPNPKNVDLAKRQTEFTNPKSALIQGRFSVVQPEDGEGIFLFAPEGDVKGAEHVKAKMGVFVDVFDATESLGLDVVEIALVEASGPKDFLMYYEDPRNGEGRAHAAAQQ